jgi:hypothetical protein
MKIWISDLEVRTHKSKNFPNNLIM